MKDSKGISLKVGDTVLVPAPDEKFRDIHNNEFAGTVLSFRPFTVTVEDQVGDFYNIEPERLTIYKEEDDQKMVDGFLKAKLN